MVQMAVNVDENVKNDIEKMDFTPTKGHEQ